MWSLAFLLLPSSQLDVSLAQNNDFNSLSLLSYSICVTNCVYVEVIITENKKGEKHSKNTYVLWMKQNQSSWIIGKYAMFLTAVSGWMYFCCFQPQMRVENIKAVIFTKCLLTFISLYLSLYRTVSEELSQEGISNIQMICFEYIFPDLLSSTSQTTIKQNEWLNSCFCRRETTACCVLFNQACYYGTNLQP